MKETSFLAHSAATLLCKYTVALVLLALLFSDPQIECGLQVIMIWK